MTIRLVRRVVIAVFVAGIVGMIIGSIAERNGVAITFGLITAAAAVGLILVTAVSNAASEQESPEELEGKIAALVTSGADETAVRELVRDAVRLGRNLSAGGDPRR